MEPLALDEVNAVTPIRLQIDDVSSDEESLSGTPAPLDRNTSDASESGIVVVPVESRTSIGTLTGEKRGSINRMGRDATPFFSTLLLFALLTCILGMFTVGLGIKIELQLGHSHATWKTSLWWGGLVNFIIGLLYIIVHLSVKKEWPFGRFAFAGYQVLLIISLCLLMVSIDFSFETYLSVKGVDTDKCTYINFQGTYSPLTSCYEPCRTHLFNTTGYTNPPSVCCCCYDNREVDENIVYIEAVKDCTIVDSTEAKLRYLTVCYVVSLIFFCISLFTSSLVQFGCCQIVPPWAYMRMSRRARYGIN